MESLLAYKNIKVLFSAAYAVTTKIEFLRVTVEQVAVTFSAGDVCGNIKASNGSKTMNDLPIYTRTHSPY